MCDTPFHQDGFSFSSLPFWVLLRVLGSEYAGRRQYFVTTQDHAPGGTTTRARLTLLDAWPDANETSHGRSLLLGEVLAGRSSVSQPFCIAVAQPFLSRSWAENGGKLGFWAAVRPFLALHNSKPILARCKRTKNTFKAPCCGSSPIAIVVWR